eukprot:3098407-Amphidinium_carterae.1
MFITFEVAMHTGGKVCSDTHGSLSRKSASSLGPRAILLCQMSGQRSSSLARHLVVSVITR